MALFLLWGTAMVQTAIALSADGPIDGEFQPIVTGIYNPGQTITATFELNLPPFTMIFSADGGGIVTTAISPTGTLIGGTGAQEYPLVVPTMIAENVVVMVDISTGAVHSTFPIGNLAIADPTGVLPSTTATASGSSSGQTIIETVSMKTSTIATTLSTSTASQSPTAVIAGASTTHISSQIPAIIGGVFGGIIITLIIGATLLFVRNRRNRLSSSSTSSSGGGGGGGRIRLNSEPDLNIPGHGTGTGRVSPFNVDIENGPPGPNPNLRDQNAEKPRHWQQISIEPNADVALEDASADTSSMQVNLGNGRRHGHHRGSRKAHPIPEPRSQTLGPPEEPPPERINLPGAIAEKETLRSQEEWGTGPVPAPLPLPVQPPATPHNFDHVDTDDIHDQHCSNPFEESEAEADAAATEVAYHHQDSGYRVPMNQNQGWNQVIEFPPAYSAT